MPSDGRYLFPDHDHDHPEDEEVRERQSSPDDFLEPVEFDEEGD